MDKAYTLLELHISYQIFSPLYAFCKEHVASGGNGDYMRMFAERFEGDWVMQFA